MNTLTGLIQYIYDTVDVVSQEPTGFIGAVSRSNKAEQAALNQDISYDITDVGEASDITPGATPPALDSQITAAGTMKLTKARRVPFHWTGDDEAKVGQEARDGITNNKFAQAFRTLRNEIEADLGALHVYASRAYAAHATTPAALFGTNLGEVAQTGKILTDNGAPQMDRSLILNTTAGAALRTLANLNANQGGDMLNTGILMNTYGTNLRESAGVVSTSAVGTGAGFVADGAHAAGATTITLKTGAGTVLVGDLVTFGANTADKYVVVSGTDGVGDIVINGPGLKTAIADGAAMSIVGVCARNMHFSRDAIHLLARLPKMPQGGDAAVDEMIVVDPVSGLPFRVAMYKGYHANQYEVSLAWGVKAVKSAHISLLLGL